MENKYPELKGIVAELSIYFLEVTVLKGNQLFRYITSKLVIYTLH